ncbi:MAG: hypothetical protein ACE5EG_13005, partial [Thermoanaerobaculia bacterium]
MDRVVLPSQGNAGWRRTAARAVIPALIGLLLIGCGPPIADLTTGEIEASIKPERALASSPGLLSRGRAVFEKQCQACHGMAGDGQGE